MAKKRVKSRRTNRHHLTPRSRILEGYDTDKDNIVLWDEEFHASWHWMFGNLTPEEVQRFIQIIAQPNTKWTAHGLKQLRQNIVEARPKLPMKCRLCGRDNFINTASNCEVCGESNDCYYVS
jgi:hypothetical protein